MTRQLSTSAESRKLSPTPDVELFVPGRIEVLGKHTDYCGGRSLLCAVDRGLHMTAAPRNDGLISVTDADTGRHAEFVFSPDLVPAVGHWSNYPMTVARRLARNFGQPLRGADITISSTLPPAAGLSSSSAVVTGITLLLAHLNHLDERPTWKQNLPTQEDLAAYLGTIENGRSFGPLAGDRGVGTFGGSQDHTAILCCKANTLSQYRFCPVRHERNVLMPEGHVFAIASSGVLAEKTGQAMAKYNRVSLRAAAIVDQWNAVTGQHALCLAEALDSIPDAPARLRTLLAQSASADFPAQDLLRRLDQHIEEARHIIPAAGDALLVNDLPRFGRLVDRSQSLAESCLENQVPQTIFLARKARELGAVAASAFGAGFGGSVWAMIASKDAANFLSAWSTSYTAGFPEESSRAVWFTTRCAPGVQWKAAKGRTGCHGELRG
jgi:galactokinase